MFVGECKSVGQSFCLCPLILLLVPSYPANPSACALLSFCLCPLILLLVPSYPANPSACALLSFCLCPLVPPILLLVPSYPSARALLSFCLCPLILLLVPSYPAFFACMWVASLVSLCFSESDLREDNCVTELVRHYWSSATGFLQWQIYANLCWAPRANARCQSNPCLAWCRTPVGSHTSQCHSVCRRFGLQFRAHRQAGF